MTEFDRRRRHRRCWLMPAAALALFAWGLETAVTAEPKPEPGETATELTNVSKSGLLLLHSGRVIKGQISRGSGEFRIRRSKGEMFVPDEMVRHVCHNLEDAYQKQRDDFETPQASDHVVLARWCMSYNLLDEARQELRAALKLEPGRIQSRRMLRRLDDLFGDKSTTAQGRGTDSIFATQDVEALGGLSQEDAENFTRRIQPILLNTCGNARCHGSAAKNDFQLVRVKPGRRSSRRLSQRNLAAALRHVDFDKPLSSPLLTVPEGHHGGKKIVFGGRSGREQAGALRQWIAAIANERTNRNMQKQEVEDNLQKTLARKSSKPKKQKLSFKPRSTADKAPRRIVDDSDAFDPSEFNARGGK